MRPGRAERPLIGAARSEVLIKSAAVASEPALEHRNLNVGQVNLHVAVQGDGPAVVLLHGFPGFWFTWRSQLDALSRGGFRAVAPDLRGFNLSDKPRFVDSYRPDRLTRDVLGLLDALAIDRAFIVGHDWGGVIAFRFAGEHPDRVEKLAVINAPHPELFRRRILHPRQLMRSWYVGLFQVPVLAEWVVTRPSVVRSALGGAGLEEAEVEAYVEALRRPGAASGAMNYYRAALRERWRAPAVIAAPTLVLWGERDRALGPEVLSGIERYARDVRIRRFPDAGHFLLRDRADEVNRELLAFLRS